MLVEPELMERLPYFPSEDTQALRRAIRTWVSGHTGGPESTAQRLGDQPWDRRLWSGITGEQGVGGLLLPESLGGLAAGYEDFAASLEEVGRGLLATPVLGSLAFGLGALLPSARSDTPTPAVAELARQIADGELVAALAVSDLAGSWLGARPTAVTAAEGHELTGESGMVVDAPRADVLLVFAELSGALGLYRVDAAACELRQRPALDPSLEMADVVFDGTPAVLLAEGQEAQAAFEHAVRLGRLALAALSVGGAESALDDAVSYALARRQFGRPIAGFQAVKHMCADALLAIQQARAVLAYAVWALDDGSPEAERALLAAKIAATEAYVLTAAHAVQVHGAMGTTREVSVQVHFRRARSLSLLLGSNDDDGDVLAGELGFGE
jgi:alkylation response protein AidB-like acyl-CoA dehydrogenase